jgi:hypothetical protein
MDLEEELTLTLHRGLRFSLPQQGAEQGFRLKHLCALPWLHEVCLGPLCVRQWTPGHQTGLVGSRPLTARQI